LRCPRCGRATSKEGEARRQRTGYCGPKCRLQRAIEELKRARRQRNHERFPLWGTACYWSAVIVAMSLVLGFTVGVFFHEFGGCIIGLGFFLAAMLLGVIFSCHALLFVGKLALLVLRIPVVLFFHARMHLLELLLIVALLGNGVGLIVGRTEEPATAIVLSVLCVTLVLGGSAWGLWASTALELKSALNRCGLILTGIFLPAACAGLAIGYVWLIEGVAYLPQEWGMAILWISIGLTAGTFSFLIIRHTYLQHFKACNAAHLARLKRWREMSRRKQNEMALDANSSDPSAAFTPQQQH